ncbi:serine/threonine-protein kinase [Thermostaphylospora chromogena]|uniref:non-specific serine/threonine protein kinase n=1 Tax=Thermostaphylospora chromogena TaxID=35622 RepID=A0A1H1ESR3_9ACTN|nr:serine/threonine-protein kinase [Thermostaphylospora chromogena]SDQ91777.1 Serine/threonine protein kinase [Thermostaphylospora chromogena]
MIGARRLAGRYRLLNPLGEGGSGTVWLATDDMLGRDVAIKEVRLGPGLDESRRRELCEAAVREANVAARLRHPSIVTVHDVLIEDGRPWLVMELLSGSSLEEMVRERGPLPPHQIARAGVHILAALAVAHAAGVVHRDIKPSNIFLTRTGRAVLTDFGIAAVEGEAAQDRTLHLVGAPAFIAPERLRGEPDGPAGDLWSLAATLYYGVEGVPPHQGRTPVETLRNVVAEPPRPPVRAGPLGSVLIDMLATDPAARPSLRDVAPRLRELTVKRPGTPAFVAPPSTPAPAPSVPAQARRPAVSPRRRTLLTATGMIATLAAIMAGTVVTTNALAADPSPAQSTPTPTRLSEKPGKFGIPVQFCKLLTAEQIKQLLPEAKDLEGKPTNQGGCEWTSPGMAVFIEPVPVFGEPEGVKDQYGTSPRRAHERFLNERNTTIPNGTIVWSWDDIGAERRSARSTGPEPVTGIGEEAFAYHIYDNRSHMKLERSQVVFRVENLVVEAAYTVIDGKRDEKAIRQGAMTLAGWTATALNRMG